MSMACNSTNGEIDGYDETLGVFITTGGARLPLQDE